MKTKKNILFTFLFSLLIFNLSFAERYPMEMEYGFIQGCTENKAEMEDYCICALKEIEKRYTAGEFVNLYNRNPQEFKKRLVKEILPACIDKLKM